MDMIAFQGYSCLSAIPIRTSTVLPTTVWKDVDEAGSAALNTSREHDIRNELDRSSTVSIEAIYKTSSPSLIFVAQPKITKISSDSRKVLSALNWQLHHTNQLL